MNSTIALIISVIIAFGVTAGLGFVIIPWLRKLKFGQTILDIGPSWHKSKQGTPNMGGIMFIIGIVLSFGITALIYYLSGGELESDYSSIMNGRELVLLFAAALWVLLMISLKLSLKEMRAFHQSKKHSVNLSLL